MHRSTLHCASLPTHGQLILFCADLAILQLSSLGRAPSAAHMPQHRHSYNQAPNRPVILAYATRLIPSPHRPPPPPQHLQIHRAQTSSQASLNSATSQHARLASHHDCSPRCPTAPPRYAAPQPAPPVSRHAPSDPQRAVALPSHDGPSLCRDARGDGG